MPTHNEKIMTAKDEIVPFPRVHQNMKLLVTSAVKAKSNTEKVRLLKVSVSEFISQISEFAKLNKPVLTREK